MFYNEPLLTLPGPQCVLSCAKENRVLPKQGFTCCLAMDGVKVLASGFEIEGKVLFLWPPIIFTSIATECVW